MQNTVPESDRLPDFEAYIEQASALELARRSLLGAPVYTVISLIMLVGTPMLMSYGWWAAAEAGLLIFLGGIRVPIITRLRSEERDDTYHHALEIGRE